MKKIVSMFLITMLLLFVCVPQQVCAEYVPPAHPDPNSGNPADYAGTWIIDGMSEQDSTWILEINEDGTYHLHNEYQDFTGDFTFTPGRPDGAGDTIKLEFDPKLGIEIILENAANGLVDISGQGLIFVRPGNKANVEEAEILKNYSRKDMIGDWLFVLATVTVHDIGMNFEFTADEILQGMVTETGDTQLIINIEKNVMSAVSPNLNTRIPFLKVSWIGRSTFKFKNASDDGYFNEIVGTIFGDDSQHLVLVASPGHPEATGMLFFDRVTGIITPEEETTEGD